MSNIPDISVIMPVYNGGLYLKEAINSILSQSFKNFELIILNDASTDNSEEVIVSFSDKRIHYVKNESNVGLIKTLNKGLSLAQGKFIARMDQDDISLPNRFQKQINFLNHHPEINVVSSKLIFIDEKGNDKDYWNDDYETTTIDEIKNYMPKLNCIGHPTVMVRAETMKYFGYNKLLEYSEDWGLWLTLLSNGYVIANFSPWISIPISIPTILTGFCKVRNAFKSGGRDFSGIFSTAFDILAERAFGEAKRKKKDAN